jgi:quercetin dioxygenase-like cupin family protein
MVQPAFLFAALAGIAVPVSAGADDHSHGLTPPEVYLFRQVPPNKAVRIVKLDIRPHDTIETHCHSGDEIGIVTQGTLMLRMGEAEYETKHQGDWFTVAPFRLMTVKNETGEVAQLYSVLVVDDDGKWLKHDPSNCEQK